MADNMETLQKKMNEMAGTIDRLRNQLEGLKGVQHPKYFVLKPSGDDQYAVASRNAMETYAKCIEDENPDLSFWMRNWIIDEKHAASNRALETSFEGKDDA